MVKKSNKAVASEKDPVGEALKALEIDHIEELSVNMSNKGRTSPLTGAVKEYPQIEDEGLIKISEKLADNKSIKILDLSGNKIGGRGGMKAFCKVLAANESIHSLYLANNNFAPKDVLYLGEALKVNKTLKVLSIANCKVEDQGATYLAEALVHNKSLEILNLGSNNIRNDGAKKIARAIMSSESPLAKLALSGNLIRAVGAKKLMKMLMEKEDLQSLDLSSNKINFKGVKYVNRLFDARKDLENGNILQLRLNNNRIHSDDLKAMKERASLARCEINDSRVELPKKTASGFTRMNNFAKTHLQLKKPYELGHNRGAAKKYA